MATMSTRLRPNHCTFTCFWYDCGHLKDQELKTCGLKLTDPNHPPPAPRAQYLGAECAECENLELTTENTAIVEARKDEALAYMKELKRRWKNQYSVSFHRRAREKRKSEASAHSDTSGLCGIKTEPVETLGREGVGKSENEIEEGRKRKKQNQAEIKGRKVVEESAHQASMVEDAMLLVDFAKETRVFPRD